MYNVGTCCRRRARAHEVKSATCWIPKMRCSYWELNKCQHNRYFAEGSKMPVGRKGWRLKKDPMEGGRPERTAKPVGQEGGWRKTRGRREAGKNRWRNIQGFWVPDKVVLLAKKARKDSPRGSRMVRRTPSRLLWASLESKYLTARMSIVLHGLIMDYDIEGNFLLQKHEVDQIHGCSTPCLFRYYCPICVEQRCNKWSK